MCFSIVFPERNVSSSSSSQSAEPTLAQEEADVGEEEKQETLEDQDMRKGVFCLHGTLSIYYFHICNVLFLLPLLEAELILYISPLKTVL